MKRRDFSKGILSVPFLLSSKLHADNKVAETKDPTCLFIKIRGNNLDSGKRILIRSVNYYNKNSDIHNILYLVSSTHEQTYLSVCTDMNTDNLHWIKCEEVFERVFSCDEVFDFYFNV